MCDNIDKYLNKEMKLIKKYSNKIRGQLNKIIKKSDGIKKLKGLQYMLKMKKSAKRKLESMCEGNSDNIKIWDLLRFTIIYTDKSKIYPFMRKIHKLPKYNVSYERLTSCGNNPYGDIYYNINMLLKIRTVGSTLLNNTSSRSHCVIEITTPDVQIVYIDLAGNEKTRYSNDRCYGDRRETAYINKDLFAIKEIIRAKSKSKKIGYRYSKIACIINGVLNSRKNSYMI